MISRGVLSIFFFFLSFLSVSDRSNSSLVKGGSLTFSRSGLSEKISAAEMERAAGFFFCFFFALHKDPRRGKSLKSENKSRRKDQRALSACQDVKLQVWTIWAVSRGQVMLFFFFFLLDLLHPCPGLMGKIWNIWNSETGCAFSHLVHALSYEQSYRLSVDNVALLPKKKLA